MIVHKSRKFWQARKVWSTYFFWSKKFSVGKFRSLKVRSVNKFVSFTFFQVPAAQPIKSIISFFFWGGGNIAGAIINFIQYYTPITTFALQSSHPLVFQAAWEVIKIKLQPCTLQPWFMAITHEVYKKKDKNCSKGEFF